MRIAGLFILAIFFPVFAHAAVLITEVMYDLSGTDTGREWVEITNTGGSSVDASGYKFFEANVNHALTLISGSGTLPSGGSAIIADDPTKFKIDWPNYSGTLFDSSFSLSNTGEPLALKDETLATLDAISYDPSLGAGGDGNTLQWNGSAFAPAAPTPGTYASASSAQDSSSAAPEAPAPSGGATVYKPPPSTLSVDISGVSGAAIEVPLHLTARVTTKGVTDPSARVSWSFGDGSFATGSAVEKTYRYAGTYLIIADASDDTVTARDELVVTVSPAQVRLLAISGDGITVANDSSERLDLSGWRLISGMGSFLIPAGMIILPKTSVLFSSAITNLPMETDARLLYPDGAIAARYAPAPQLVPVAQPSDPTAGSNQVQTVEQQTPADDISISGTAHEDTAVSAPAAATELAAAGAALSPTETTEAADTPRTGLLRSPWTFGFLGIMALAGGAFIFL